MFELTGESLKSAVNKLKFVDDEKALKNALETLKKSLLRLSLSQGNKRARSLTQGFRKVCFR